MDPSFPVQNNSISTNNALSLRMAGFKRFRYGVISNTPCAMHMECALNIH